MRSIPFAPQRGPVPAPDSELPLPQRRLLVAEDDADLRDLLVRAFRGDGFLVEEARDGRELFAHIERHVASGDREGCGIAAIVSDVRMPGLSGLDVLAVLRCGLCRTPVVLITAFADAAVREEAQQAGAVLVDKPFLLADLRRIVRMLVAAV